MSRKIPHCIGLSFGLGRGDHSDSSERRQDLQRYLVIECQCMVSKLALLFAQSSHFWRDPLVAQAHLHVWKSRTAVWRDDVSPRSRTLVPSCGFTSRVDYIRKKVSYKSSEACSEPRWYPSISPLAIYHSFLRSGSKRIFSSHHFSCKLCAPASYSFILGHVVVHL